MDNQEIQNEEIEINLAELFQVLKEHLHIIIISTFNGSYFPKTRS